MANEMKRTETIHVSEAKRTSSSSSQWLLEKQHGTHPISDNNELKVFICGEEGFKDIAAQIAAAKASIDICCWGFDPAMELERGGGRWPRGPTYGDLLIAAGKRSGVKVRLLVWYDKDATLVASKNPRNMPGVTHDSDPSRADLRTEAASKVLSAQNCLANAVASGKRDHLTIDQIHARARRDYCIAWYAAALGHRLENVEIRTRAGDSDAVIKSLASEASPPDKLSVEGGVMRYFGTHHQKPILIDFYHDNGAKAVGYVMGLNSLTEYWDTCDHSLENPQREQELVHTLEPDLAFSTMKPYRDYACRIDRGRALVSLYNNFITAWERAVPNKGVNAKSELGSRGIPEGLLRPGAAGSPHVQIVRTQPEEGDKSIKDVYFNATDLATRAAGYLYVENQYLQLEEWSQRLLAKRKASMDQWNASRKSAGMASESMPVMHVFIVIPAPEREGMIPRTYDTLAALGQGGHMDGQAAMIDKANKQAQHRYTVSGTGVPIDLGVSLPEVVEHANRIAKPTSTALESQYGIKVCTAMLNACGGSNAPMKYREIYIHSKLLLIDDTFFTLGSANLNQRSMAADSEINVATIDPVCAKSLRERIWGQLSGNAEDCDGGDGSRAAIAIAFKTWEKLMEKNSNRMSDGARLKGFLLPLADGRSSTSRVG